MEDFISGGHAFLLSELHYVIDAVSKAAEKIGLVKTYTFKNIRDPLAASSRKKVSIVLLDWEVGSASKLTNFLQRCRSKKELKQVFMVIVTEEITQELMATAADYQVPCLVEKHDLEDLPEILQRNFKKYYEELPISSVIEKIKGAEKEGKHEEAEQMIAKLYQRHPEVEKVRLEYANCLCNHDSLEESIEICGDILEENQYQLRAKNTMARCLIKQGKLQEGLGILEQSQILSPFTLERLTMLGDAYIQTNQLHQAEESFAKALQQDSTSKEAKVGMMQVKVIQGEVEASLELLNDCTSNREVASMFNTVAVGLARKKLLDSALKLYDLSKQAISDSALLAKVTFNIGLAYYRAKDLEMALKCVQEAARLDSNFEKAKRFAVKISQKIEVLGGIEVCRTKKGHARDSSLSLLEEFSEHTKKTTGISSFLEEAPPSSAPIEEVRPQVKKDGAKQKIEQEGQAKQGEEKGSYEFLKFKKMANRG